MSEMNTIDYAKMTPMIRQFYELKSRVPDAVLFFRMGDFYEIFGDDALDVAPKLELILTSRERGDKQKIPFCGVPHHSAKNYWLKLLNLGYKVALADQVENPAEAKGLVKRDIVRIFTPGCIDELEGLTAERPNYLMAIFEQPGQRKFVVLVVDVSTGECRLGTLADLSELEAIVSHFRPRELLARRFFHDDLKPLLSSYTAENSLLLGSLPESHLRSTEDQIMILSEVFGVETTESLPCGKVPGGDPLVASVLYYIRNLGLSLEPFLTVKPLYDSGTMRLSEIAVRDLEIFETLRRRQVDGSLFKEISRTITPMGARLLRASLAAPFTCSKSIQERQERIRCLLTEVDTLVSLRKSLRACSDIERLATRLLSRKASPTELATLRKSLQTALHLADLIAGSHAKKLFEPSIKTLGSGKVILDYFDQCLVDEPGSIGSDLCVIKEGFDEEFDRLRQLSNEGNLAIQSYEQKLREKTGIASLKIKQHKTFGLLIEVTKSNLNKVPKDFIRRQTMVNNERFVTDALVDLDHALASAQEQAVAKEVQIYTSVLERLGQYKECYYQIAISLAHLDLIQGLSWIARENQYVCPALSKDGTLALSGARHPVVERFVGRDQFIPNNITMNEKQKHLLITGPNMAGKSTVMRQTALAAILHQIGSFVPALEAKMPIFDRIFTRVGAADDLSKGQSTFMVEMSEVAHILREASDRSLVILDEVGRGTSSQDGMAIASAILENLSQKVKCYSLFATHYHELVPLADSLSTVTNVQIEVVKKGDQVHFSHRLISGASGSSFGIEVAKLAGVPTAVIARANEFLRCERQDKINEKSVRLQSALAPATTDDDKSQVKQKQRHEVPLPLETFGLSDVGDSLVNDNTTGRHPDLEKILLILEKVNIHKTTPLQALNILDELTSVTHVFSLSHEGSQLIGKRH